MRQAKDVNTAAQSRSVRLPPRRNPSIRINDKVANKMNVVSDMA